MSPLTALTEQARRERLPMDIVVREHMLEQFIASVFASTDERELALKGGMAMRVVAGSLRYTKDVDLQTSPDVPMARIRNLVRTAIEKAIPAGTISDLQIGEPKQTPTVQRWKLHGFITGTGEPVNMTVEVSRRGLPDSSRLVAVPYGSTGTKVVCYSPTTIAAAKVDALLAPNRLALRDVYDLHRLAIDMNITPPLDLLAGWGRETLLEAANDLWPKIEQMTWQLFEEQLSPNLPRDAAERLDEAMWDDMRMRTDTAVREWLNLALDTAPRYPGAGM